MPLESAQYISQLNELSPETGDLRSSWDDQLRLIKGVLRATFPSTGTLAMVRTQAELNAAPSTKQELTALMENPIVGSGSQDIALGVAAGNKLIARIGGVGGPVAGPFVNAAILDGLNAQGGVPMSVFGKVKVFSVGQGNNPAGAGQVVMLGRADENNYWIAQGVGPTLVTVFEGGGQFRAVINTPFYWPTFTPPSPSNPDPTYPWYGQVICTGSPYPTAAAIFPNGPLANARLTVIGSYDANAMLANAKVAAVMVGLCAKNILQQYAPELLG